MAAVRQELIERRAEIKTHPQSNHRQRGLNALGQTINGGPFNPLDSELQLIIHNY